MSADDIVQPDAVDSIGRLRAERDAAYEAGESNMNADYEIALDALVDDEFEVGPSTVAALIGRLQAELGTVKQQHWDTIVERDRYENELAAANADAERLDRALEMLPPDRRRARAAHRARIEGDQ